MSFYFLFYGTLLFNRYCDTLENICVSIYRKFFEAEAVLQFFKFPFLRLVNQFQFRCMFLNPLKVTILLCHAYSDLFLQQVFWQTMKIKHNLLRHKLWQY